MLSAILPVQIGGRNGLTFPELWNPAATTKDGMTDIHPEAAIASRVSIGMLRQRGKFVPDGESFAPCVRGTDHPIHQPNHKEDADMGMKGQPLTLGRAASRERVCKYV